MQIDSSAVMKMLPHREPLQLIKGASISSPGMDGVVSFRLTSSVPLMDGVETNSFRQELVLEAAAQSFGVVLGSAFVESDGTLSQNQDDKHLLLGFNDVLFSEGDIPLDKLMQIAVTRQQALGEIFSANFLVSDAERKIAEGSVMVMKGKA